MSFPSQSKVCFFFEAPKFSLKKRIELKLFIEHIFKKYRQKLESLNYIFTSDKRVLEINKAYLKHDYFTDIISFELSEPGSPVQGEIYISIERVRDNAVNEDVSFKEELLRVIFHGALHLCGFRDKTLAEKTKMRQLEDSCLKEFKVFHVKH